MACFSEGSLLLGEFYLHKLFSPAVIMHRCSHVAEYCMGYFCQLYLENKLLKGESLLKAIHISTGETVFDAATLLPLTVC